MDGGDRILVAAGLTAAVVVGAFVLWGPGGAPRVRKRRGQIAGLQNLGRTCFLNTMLQALAACPIFIDWLKRFAKADSNNSMITTLYTVIEGWCNFLLNYSCSQFYQTICLSLFSVYSAFSLVCELGEHLNYAGSHYYH